MIPIFGSWGKPSREKFAAIVLKRIAERGGPTDFVFQPDTFEIRRPTNRGFLGNTYDAYCAAKGSHRQMILDNFVAIMVERPDHSESSLEEVREDLVTVVRERALFSFTSLLWQLEGVKKPPEQSQEPMTDWFAKTLVIDSPSSMSLVNEDQVAAWGVPSYELYSLGLEKLRAAKPPAFSEDRGVFRGLWNDDYDSSRILVPGIFEDLPLRGEAVVCIPNRLTLLVAGSDDTDAIGRMLTTAEEIVRTQPKPQNPAPLLVRDGEISDFSVPDHSPIFNQVARAKRIAALLYYNEQKVQLETLYEKNGKDLFVASYSLNQQDSGAYASVSVWTKGIATLLPVTDEVILVDPDKPKGENVVARAPWPLVAGSLGDLMLDTKMFPTRFYVSGFPTDEQLRRLVAT